MINKQAQWVPVPELQIPKAVGAVSSMTAFAMCAYKDRLYVMGGSDSANAVSFADIFWCKINSDGSLAGPWKSGGSLPAGQFDTVPGMVLAGYAIYGNRIYLALPSCNKSPTFDTNQVWIGTFFDDGTVGNWQIQQIPQRIAGNSHYAKIGVCIGSNGYLYVGGQSVDANVYYAKVLPDGSLGNFTAQAVYPAAVANNNAYSFVGEHNGYLILGPGGTGSSPAGQAIASCKMNPDGSLGVYQNIGSISVGRYRGFCLKVQGGLFFMGGSPAGSGAGATASCEFIPLEADGQSCGPSIPMPSMKYATRNAWAVAYNGVVYCMQTIDQTNTFRADGFQQMSLKF